VCVFNPGDDNLKSGGIGDDSDSDGDKALLVAGIHPGTATDPAQALKNLKAEFAAKSKAKSKARTGLIKKQAKLIKKLEAFVLASAEKNKQARAVVSSDEDEGGGTPPPESGSDQVPASARELFSVQSSIAMPPDTQLRASTRRITKTPKAQEIIDLRSSSEDDLEDDISTTPIKRRRVPAATGDDKPPAAVKRSTKTLKSRKTKATN
jgi:hypothetical protein